MVERLADLDHEPVVGQFYLVPTVVGIYFDLTPRPWPVLLPFHDDKEILGFAPWHYHPDPRFIPETVWRSLDFTNKWYGRSANECIAGSPLQTHERLNPEGLPRPVERRRKCIRHMPDRSWMSRVHFAKKLQAAYRDASLAPGMVCPHKGVCLKSMPIVDGVVTCPAHGLQWNVETGLLVGSD